MHVARCTIDRQPGHAYVAFEDGKGEVIYMSTAIKCGKSTSMKELVRRAFRQAPRFLPGGMMTYAWQDNRIS